MAENEIGQYLEVDNDNVDIAGISVQENIMRPPAVNNAFRALQGALKRWFRADLFRLRSPADQSRQLAFALAGGASTTTRTATFPDGDGTVMFTNTTLANAQASAGSVVDSRYASFKTYFSSSSAIPVDDTLPTSTEGDQIMQCAAISPKSVTNKIRVRVIIEATANPSGNIIAALHNGGSLAVAVGAAVVSVAGNLQTMTFEHEYVPGSTSAITFSVRAGPGNSGTMIFNGNQVQRFFGGGLLSSMTVEEIKA